MTFTTATGAQPGVVSMVPGHAPLPTYRLEGEFRETVPVGAFADGIRFLSRCDAAVVSTPLGSSKAGERVSLDVNGLVVTLDGSAMPLSAVIAAPGFEFPDLDFRLTGTAYIRTTGPRQAHLEGSVVSIDGWVNFESGELQVEAHPM